MARESTITFEQVAAAADGIKAGGGKPTSRNIREALGTGSMATVLKLLQQWQGGQMKVAESPVVLPGSLQRALVDFIGQEVAGAKSELQADLVAAQQANNDMIAESERQASTIELQAEALEISQSEKAGLAGRLAQVEFDLKKSADDLSAERQAAEAARVELAKAQLRLEAMPRLEADLNTARAEIKEIDKQRQTAERELSGAKAKIESLENLKAEHARELAGIEAQNARAIEKTEARLQEAAQQRDEANKRAQASSEALSTERVSVQACHARLESAERDVNTANEAASKARAEAKKSAEEAAELRGQLSATKNKPADKRTPAKSNGEKK